MDGNGVGGLGKRGIEASGRLELRLRESRSRLKEMDREDATMGHELDEWRMGGRGNGRGETRDRFEDR